MRRILYILALVLPAVAVVVAGAGYWGWRELQRPLRLTDDGLIFDVARGASLSRVTRELADRGILQHPKLIDWYASFEGSATSIHAGEYRLAAGINALGLLEKLTTGDVVLHQFTIIEGLSAAQMIARLRMHPAISATESAPELLMAELGRAGEHPEGQFLPDTYSFPRGTTDIELLGWANQALWTVLEQHFASSTATDILSDPYQGLILASIIEKETALASERSLISGVFHARLRRGMRLQTDPTVIYGLGDAFDGDLTTRQLNTDTPYNTYTRGGLPPTPIALAGEASIAAAFAPVDDGSLYFVATGEPDGSHAFSRTLEEHNAAVRRYLARQRSTE